MGVAALLLAAGVLVSRMLGYLRDMALANRLGVGGEADAYYAAFQLPDLLNYLLVGGALSIAFLPMYTRVRDRDGAEAAHELFRTILGTLFTAVTLATAVLWVFAEPLVALQFPRFDEATRALTVRLTRIMLPAQIFFVGGGIVGAVLMAEGRFGSQALAPLVYNGCVLAGGLLSGDAEGFAWGALGGACLGGWVLRVLDLRRTHRIRMRVAFFGPAFRRYLWAALPLMFGVSLVTVDEWYVRWFGAALAVGTVAVLSFARKLMLTPVAVLGQALGTAALPTLARLFATGQGRQLAETIERTLITALWLAALAAAALASFAGPLVELLYHHGRFSAEAAAQTATALRVMALGIPAWVIRQVGVRGFYAREETWRPMLLGTAMALAALPLYWFLGERAGAVGLAAAGALAMTGNALATLAWARARHGAPRLGPLSAVAVRALAVATLAGLAGAAAASALPPAGGGKLTAALEIAVGSAVFGLVALAGLRTLADAGTWSLLKRLAARVPRRLAR
jgi:putative peptidoglycan lipid II flippase